MAIIFPDQCCRRFWLWIARNEKRELVEHRSREYLHLRREVVSILQIGVADDLGVGLRETKVPTWLNTDLESIAHLRREIVNILQIGVIDDFDVGLRETKGLNLLNTNLEKIAHLRRDL